YLKEMGKGFSGMLNDPIKGFGLLTSYAQRRFAELTSIGRERIDFVHPSLSAEAQVFERAILQLSRQASGLLRKYRKDVVNHQFPQKRLADGSIDIFVGLAILSRVSTMIRDRGIEKCADELLIAKHFAEQARIRLDENLWGSIERPHDG